MSVIPTLRERSDAPPIQLIPETWWSLFCSMILSIFIRSTVQPELTDLQIAVSSSEFTYRDIFCNPSFKKDLVEDVASSKLLFAKREREIDEMNNHVQDTQENLTHLEQLKKDELSIRGYLDVLQKSVEKFSRSKPSITDKNKVGKTISQWEARLKAIKEGIKDLERVTKITARDVENSRRFLEKDKQTLQEKQLAQQEERVVIAGLFCM